MNMRAVHPAGHDASTGDWDLLSRNLNHRTDWNNEYNNAESLNTARQPTSQRRVDRIYEAIRGGSTRGLRESHSL